MSGSDLVNRNASYGSLGVTNPSNIPGSRMYPSGWYDIDRQKYFLFGGNGWAEPLPTLGTLNDFWSGDFIPGPLQQRPPSVGGPPPTAPTPAPVAPAPVAQPTPRLRVEITSTTTTRPDAAAICAGFIQYLNLSSSDLSCIAEIPANSSSNQTTHFLLLTMATSPGRTAFNQLLSNSTLRTSFLATIATSTAGVYSGASLEFNPVIIPCAVPAPEGAVCDSSRGIWVIDRSVSITNNSTYVFISPTEVRGNFVSGPNSTVVLSYLPASLTITGCAKFEGNLVLSGPPVVVSTNTSYVLATYTSLCPNLPGEPPAKFSGVNWNTQPRAEKDCQTVSANPEYAPTQLSVLLIVDSSKCDPEAVVGAGISPGATAGIVIGVAVLVGLIIAAVIGYRRFFKPKNLLDQEELALAAANGGLTSATTSSASTTGSKKNKKKGETEYGALDIDAFNAEREGSAQIVSIPAADVKMLQRLGGGAYGDVWLGQMRDGAFVAVKRMKNSVLAAQAAAFFSEASIMMQITDNTHVVQMYGMIADAGEYGLVMEFMAGGSLEIYLSNLKSKLPTDSPASGDPVFVLRSEARLFDLTFIIASGLACLATNGIVHRDLSARNILLDETKTFAKVSDFGLSRRLDQASTKGKTVSTVGPIRWMSPENIRDKVYSEKSDVWSFGCTLIELLTGEVPFYSFNGGLPELAVAIRDSNASPLEYLELDVKARHLACPKWCTELLRRCFAVNPADRPTFDEIRDILKQQKHPLYVSLMDRLENREAVLNQLQPSANEIEPVTPGNYGPFAPPSSSSSSIGDKRGSASNKRSSAKMRGSVRLNRDAIGTKAVDSPVHLLCRLGEGSFGAVFLASVGGSYIAVKQLSLPDSANAGERAKAEGLIYSEAAIMAKLKQNRNVVAIYGLAVEGEKMSIMMEFAARGSLETFVQKHQGKIPETFLFRVAIGMARGMAGLAAQKIVHRDLAARNVLLDSTFEPKISDFGLSRDIDAEETAGKTTSQTGPIRWMAPEALRQTYSEKSDVWAYGCVLVEILSGDSPYGDVDLPDIVIGVRDNRWTPLNVRDAIRAAKCNFSWMETAPAYLLKLAEMCFEKDPDDRPTFTSIVQHLEENIPEHVATVEARREKQREKRAKLIEAIDQIVV
jgi:serine/threonine protein kinase